MSDKILVAYASRCRSTGEVAEAIGQTLGNGTGAVKVRLAREMTDLIACRAVAVGSAIRAGKWLPEAVEFVKTHRQALSRVPVAYFLVCSTLGEDTEENRREVAAYLAPVREMVQPVDEGRFAGAIDYNKFSLLMWLMMKAIGAPEGDWRDWEAIRAWAAGLRPKLMSVNRRMNP